jgi:hypothetical protein
VNVGQITLIIGVITNPTTSTSTSNFRLYTLSNSVIIDRNELFGTVSYGAAAGNFKDFKVDLY